MSEKHYVGEVNTEVRVDCGADVSSATVRKLFLKKPNGVIVEKTPLVYNGRFLRFFTTQDDFNISGEYEVQAYIEMGDWKGRGQTARFVIYDLYD